MMPFTHPSEALKSKARLVALVLNLRMQKEFYLDYYADLDMVYEWLQAGKDKEEKEAYRESMPDICSFCLKRFPWTPAGRSRERCGWCENSTPFLQFFWSDQLCAILDTSESVLESYMAAALCLIEEGGNNCRSS